MEKMGENTIANTIVVIFALWYIFYIGLEASVPYYDFIDDFIFMVMAVSVFVKILFAAKRPAIPSKISIPLFIIIGLILISMFYNGSSMSLSLEYTYLILRPFILLLFLFSFDVQPKNVIEFIFRISKILILFNLPMLLYCIIKYNIKALTVADYNDSIIGFFPFNYSDALVPLYVIVLSKYFFEIIFKGYKKKKLFIFYYGLLIFTMNLKLILLLSAIFIFTITMTSKNKIRYLLIFSTIIILFISVISKRIGEYSGSIELAPVVYLSSLIITGAIDEYNFLLGTGPGTFTSPTSIRSNSYLAYKYGFYDRLEYYEQSGTTTGTFTSLTSSTLTLLGDIGVIGVVIYFGFILSLLKLNFSKIEISPIYFLGFVSGVTALTIGLFLDYWFWGLYIFLFILSSKIILEKSTLESIDIIKA